SRRRAPGKAGAGVAPGGGMERAGRGVRGMAAGKACRGGSSRRTSPIWADGTAARRSKSAARAATWGRMWSATWPTVANWSCSARSTRRTGRSEEHTSELQSRENLVCRLLLEKKKKKKLNTFCEKNKSKI